MARHSVRIHIDTGALLGSFQRSLQQSMDLVSFGLLSAESLPEGELQLPGSYFHVAPAANETRTVQAMRSDFQNWVLASGLRDCVEAAAGFLDEVRQVCAVYSLGGQATINGAEWNAKINSEKKEFHRLEFPRKIVHLRQHYGDQLISELCDEVLSINKARRCLVHRRGKVSKVDLNSNEALIVSWLKMDILIDGPHGRRVVVPPADVDAGEIVALRWVKTNKQFREREVVSFSAQDFSELCWTFFVFAKQIVSNVVVYGQAQGVPIKEVAPAPASISGG